MQESIKLYKNEIEKESNNISIPFFPINEKHRSNGSIKLLIGVKLAELYSNSIWKDGSYSIKESFSLASRKIENWEMLSVSIFNELEKELKNNWLNLKNVEWLEITNWILSFKLKDKFWIESNIYFDLSARSIDKLLVKQQIKEVKEEVEASVVDYTIWTTVFALTFLPTIKGELSRWDRFLKKLIFTENWVKHTLEINEKLKENFSEIDIINVLEKKWVEFNTKTNKFEFKDLKDAVQYKSLENTLKKWTYDDYVKQMKDSWISEIKNEKEFKKLKKEAWKFIEETREEYLKNPKISFWKWLMSKIAEEFEKVWWKAMHYVLLPIFLQELHKNSWSEASYISSWVEIVWFMTWASLWAKIPFNHPLVKLVSSVVVWGAFALVWEEWLNHYDTEILKYLPNKDIQSNKKNIDIQLLTGWSIYDALDTINLNVSENFLWLGIDMTNNINLWISPEIYLAKRFWWVKHWNKELDEYKVRTSEKIDKFLEKDFRYSDILKKKNLVSEASEYVFSSSFEENLYNVVNYKDWSRAMKYEEKAHKITKDIINFIDKNLDKDIYVWDTDAFNTFLEQLKKELSKKIKNKTSINEILWAVKYYCEKEFNEEILKIVWSENWVINDLQKESIKNTKRVLFDQYHFYKKEVKFESISYNSSEENDSTIWSFNKENNNHAEDSNKKWLIKSLVNIQIDKNRIDRDFIDNYKENINSKKELINLALEWKLSDKQVEWKYIVISNWVYTLVPTIVNWKARYYSVKENIKDLLYISNLSEKDRKFIKNRIFRKIKLWEKIVPDSSVWIHIVWPKWNNLLKNDKIHDFYKRMLIFKKQDSFINNIEKNWDAVEWASPIMDAINVVWNKISSILNW